VPGDLSFYAPDRGLMTVGGNNSEPEGIWSWDGVQWHQLSTVCGGGDVARIAWAGPDEFWTIARPSRPRVPDAGLALCHFKDGQVVGSYSSVPLSEDAYLSMDAAACNGPSDCWFAGDAGQDGTGTRSGGFHLHWDGTTLSTVYAPQGRAVSDLLFSGGQFFESTFVAGAPGGSAASAILREPETTPHLLHRITGGTFSNDPFVASDPAGGTDLRALDADGSALWAVGGGATFEGSSVSRTPLAARLDAGGAWGELTLKGDSLPTDLVFGDVAAVPGSGGAAWVTLIAPTAELPGGDDGVTARPEIAHIAPDGTVQVVALAPTGAVKGAAVRIDCPAANDCWVATALGFLYRLAGAPTYASNGDPAFQGTITVRPNEAAEESVSDEPPEDDSLLLAPPIEIPPAQDDSDSGSSTCKLPKLITKQHSKVKGKKKLKLVISFKLARRARIGLNAQRGGKVVARAKLRALPKGSRSLTLNVTRKRYPTKLSFVIRDDTAKSACAAAAK
jgi:hypothetical protein